MTENSNAADKSIKINIYGCSAAGKTTFLYELIRQLCPEGRYNNAQEPRVKINKKAENFRDITKEKLGDKKSISTWKDSEGIEISIRNDFFGGGAKGTRLIQSWQLSDWITLTFHDVRGEEIRKLLDDAKANPEAKKKIEQVLKDCQCFLFFFDPTYSESTKSGHDIIDINTFHKDEVRQASILFDHVPECRPQDPLPILFIQTHRDILERKSDDDKQRAKNWFADVFKLLKEKYKAGYGDAHEDALKVILNHEANRFQVNSLNKGDVFGPLERICEIKDQVKPKIVSGFPIGIIATISAIIIATVLFIVSNLPKVDAPPPIPPPPINI